MAVSSQDIAILDNDLYVINGDFQIAESDEQHISDTLTGFPGWFKQFPTDGVGILQYLRSSGQDQELARSARIQLTADGYRVGEPEISITNDSVTINPNAEKL